MQYLNNWLNYLRYNKRLQPHTCQEYSNELLRFSSWLSCNHICQDAVTHSVLTQYVALRGRTLAASTQSLIVTYLRSYYSYLWQQGIKSENVARYLVSPRAAYQFREAVAPAACKAVWQHHCLLYSEYRAKALCALILATGLRLSEVLHLRFTDIHKAEQRLVVLGKGGKQRSVYYSPEAAAALNAYCRHPERKQTVDGFVFDYPTDRLARQEVAALFNQYTHDRVNPHRLRHTFALNMLQAGLPLNDLMQLLGHSNLETTAIYLRTHQTRLQANYSQAFHNQLNSPN